MALREALFRSSLLVKIKPAGDQAVTVEFADRIDEAVNARVIALDRSLAESPIAGIIETVPTYRSLLIYYDPCRLHASALEPLLETRIGSLSGDRPPSARRWRIPVCYEGEKALDLAELAAMKGMTRDAVTALHMAADYRVYMIGFAPGFAYLGGLPDVLHTPRLDVPRQKVAAGSVGIGGAQAAINSVTGPSGWRYIGRTPVCLFNPERAEPSLFRAGDRIAFFAIGEDAFAALGRRAEAGEAIVVPEAP